MLYATTPNRDKIGLYARFLYNVHLKAFLLKSLSQRRAIQLYTHRNLLGLNKP